MKVTGIENNVDNPSIISNLAPSHTDIICNISMHSTEVDYVFEYVSDIDDLSEVSDFNSPPAIDTFLRLIETMIFSLDTEDKVYLKYQLEKQIIEET